MKKTGLLATTLFLLNCGTVLAEIPDHLEPDYSEAVLAYNAKDYDKSLRLLNELIKQAPEVSEFLELKALALKSHPDKSETAKTYEDLIELKKKEGRPEKESAPYHFELGVIRYGERKFDEAKAHLAIAREHDFNEGATNLYLGMFAFQAGSWGEAEEYFHDVTSSSADELKPASYFYMGQAQAKTDYAAGAIQNLLLARSSAQSIIDDSNTSEQAKNIAKQIHGAAEKALKPFDRSTLFASVGFMTGYDSNPLSVPDNSSSGGQTGTATPKETFFAGVGYSTSPLGAFHFVPSVRMSANMNLDSGASAAEFLGWSASLPVMRNPLARFSYGLKLDGNFTFRNGGDAESDPTRFKFRPFLVGASFGPVARYELFKKVMVGVEITGDPAKYLQDSTDESYKRTGFGDGQRVYVQNEAGRRFLNPYFGLKHANNGAGSQFRAEIYTVSVANQMHLSSSMDLSASVDMLKWNYKERPFGRRDTTWQGAVSLTRKFTPKWTGIASADFTNNTARSSDDGSTHDAFSYSRVGMNVGASYQF